MNLRMLYHDEPVMEMTILSNPADIIVTSWEVINPTLLPEGLKPAFDKTKDHNMQMVALTQWMNQRAIPNYRINLDDCILSLHHLPRHLFGRMHRYQHTAALLSHFASGFDDYIITPKTVENLCYAPQDPRFINLYRLFPITDSDLQKRKRQPVCAADRCLRERVNEWLPYQLCSPSLSFTIPSEVPSWWERGENGLLLKQMLPEWQEAAMHTKAKFLMEHGDQFGFAGKRNLADNIFSTDFSALGGYDVSFVNEYLPHIQSGAKFFEQLKELMPDYTEEAIDALEKCIWASEECNVAIEAAEIGIACNKQTQVAVPVIIL